jgi:rhamnosyltransferase
MSAYQTPKVSIVMRTKDVAWVVDRALASLFSQRNRNFELIVVDSGSRDATLDLVRRYPCKLIQIPAERYYPGKVLNEAIRETSCDLVVFQNSDVAQLGAHALDRLIAPFEDPRVAATYARQVVRPEAHTWVRRDYEKAFPERGDAPPWLPYSLPFAALRRSVWESRPFYVDAWGSEDTEWGAWARSAGHIVRYVPECVVMHSHNYTLKQLWGRRFIEGEADAFIDRAHVGPADAALGFVRSVAKDAVAHMARRDAWGALASPARRAVYHLAHLRGHQLGESRIASGSTDASVGQRAVLSRYG